MIEQVIIEQIKIIHQSVNFGAFKFHLSELFQFES